MVNQKETARYWKISVLILGVIIVAGLLFSSIKIVSAGYRGVLITLGKVDEKVLHEGVHFVIPYMQKVVMVDVKVQKDETSQTAASKDLQSVTTTIAVNYTVNEETVNDLYQTIGLDFQSKIIDPSVSEALKAVTANYKADELISKREEVSSTVKALLTEKMSKYDLIVKDLNIKEFKFSESFNASIEEKQAAEQKSLKAQRDLERIKIEAQQKVTQAQAEAEALKLKNETVTDKVIELKKIEIQEAAIQKWDGKLPTVTGGATPFIDISSVQSEK